MFDVGIDCFLPFVETIDAFVWPVHFINNSNLLSKPYLIRADFLQSASIATIYEKQPIPYW